MEAGTQEKTASKKEEIKQQDSAYELKRIEFGARTVPIILQNENGPCPLIALGNLFLCATLCDNLCKFTRSTV